MKDSKKNFQIINQKNNHLKVINMLNISKILLNNNIS